MHVRWLEGQQAQLAERARVRAEEGAKLRKARLAMGLTLERFLPFVQLKHRQHLAQMEKGLTAMHPRVRAWMKKQGLFGGKGGAW